jgi:hypothetical protein
MITACKRALRGDHAHFLSGISEAVEYRVPWRRLIPDKGGTLEESAAIGAIFFWVYGYLFSKCALPCRGLLRQSHSLRCALGSVMHVAPTGTTAQFDPSRTKEQLTEDVTEPLKLEIERVKTTDRGAADERLRALSADQDQLLASITAKYEHAKQKAHTAWLITLAPPVGSAPSSDGADS